MCSPLSLLYFSLARSLTLLFILTVIDEWPQFHTNLFHIHNIVNCQSDDVSSSLCMYVMFQSGRTAGLCSNVLLVDVFLDGTMTYIYILMDVYIDTANHTNINKEGDL